MTPLKCLASPWWLPHGTSSDMTCIYKGAQ
ncbi:hypothetical protein COLO4_35453 [Corchorus olitorius]|uniref:Uncharacterized protein n=1 Tax=Corchorus olitorius TaxID=93759 RepID=A0A1R3GGP5_9ROSI|nr:hypothetical protein COLO4_35453 [Corchorus olitorius]